MGLTPHPDRRWLVRYGSALAAAGIGLGVHLGLQALAKASLSPYITFYPVVMLVSLFFGLRPGLVAAAASALVADWFFIPPAGLKIESPAEALSLTLFLGNCILISLLAEYLRRAQDKAAAYDREQALRDIRQQQEFLARVLERASQPFAVGYPDGRLGMFNPAFEQLTGYTAHELRFGVHPSGSAGAMESWSVGALEPPLLHHSSTPILQHSLKDEHQTHPINWIENLTPPEWREQERQKLEELVRTGQPVRYEKEYVRKDGRRVPIELLVHLSRGANGEPEYYYSFLTDISDRKRAEEELRQLNESLERRVAEQTAKVRQANEQLEQRVRERTAELEAAKEAIEASRHATQRLLEEALAARQASEQANARLHSAVQSLDASRKAAVNLMEDALQARKQAETVSAELRQNQAHQLRLNRILKALKDSSLAMIRATSETQYLAEVCQVVVEDCGHAMVWIGLVEPEDQQVHPAAYSGFEQGYLETLHITWADTDRGRGPTGTAIRTGLPVVCRDTLTDPALAPWRQEALERGYRSSVAIPLLHAQTEVTSDEGKNQTGPSTLQPFNASTLQRAAPVTPKAFGALTIYASEPDAFAEDELKLLTQLADDVSYCIRALREQEERRQAEQRTQLLAETASKLLATDSPQSVVEDLCRRVLYLLSLDVFFNYLLDDPAGVRLSSVAGGSGQNRDRLSDGSRMTGGSVEALKGSSVEASPAQGFNASTVQPFNASTRHTSLPRLHLNACVGIPAEEARRVEWLEFGTALCGCAAKQGQRLVAEDIQHTNESRAALVRSLGIQAFAAFPLIAQGCVIGTLSFGTRTRPRLTEQELDLLKAVADQVAIAMERQRAKAALLQTAENLKRSNLDLEQFAYVASHDLQEPLRAVGGYIRLLERQASGHLDERAKGFLHGAIEGALRMERLINDLLDYARVDSWGHAFAPTDLEGVLRRALDNLQPRIKSEQAVITHEPLPKVSVDSTQLMQVFQNLISNALKFRGEPAPAIHVAASQQNGNWLISVRDNGIGIDPEYFGKLFHLFQRLHNRRQYPGTGIGLAVCKRIIERHGGSIWVESQVGKGATFYFTLPATRE